VLRITWAETDRSTGAAMIEGEIAGDHVRELARFAAAAHRPGLRVFIDMAHVTFVDSAGAALLRRLKDQGFAFVNGSSFVSTLLDSPVNSTPRAGESE
jgi:anti-anti-sigma regulatory factor